MNGKQLKNSILQWAIQGKLVPQDPNDEPASVLLDKIRQEKERLIKEKKIKRDKNASIIYRGEDNSYYEKILATREVKCIDEEIPFEIPQGWEWCRLRDIIIFIGGYAYDSHSFLEKSEYQVLRLGNIKNDTINKSVNPVFIDEILAQDTVRFRCLKNDILVTMTGTRKKRDYFYTVLIDTDYSNMYFNQRVGCLRAIYSPIALWLNKVLKAETILHQVFQYETGTANQGNLGASNIMNTLIPLPPVTEQFRIVKKLEEVHTYVFQYDKAQCELDNLNFGIRNTIKKSLVQEAIQGKLVPQISEEGTAQELLEQIKAEKQRLVKEGKLKKSAINDSVIFKGDDNKYYEQIGGEVTEIELPLDFPSSWSLARLNAVCQLTDGLKTTGKQCLLDAKYLRGKSFGTIVEQGKLVYKGDNIVLVDGENSGEVFIVPQDGYMGSTFKQLWISSSMYEPYVLAFIQFYKETLRNSKKGAAIPHLNKDLFYRLIIGIPPLQEQRRIVQKIEQLTQLLK